MKSIGNNKLMIIGILFITAIFVAIIGGVLIEAELELMINKESFSVGTIIVGMILEFGNVLCVLVIGYLFIDYFDRKSNVSTIYFITRTIEALVSLSAIVIVFLIILKDANSQGIEAISNLQDSRIFLLNKGVPLMFAITAFVLYYGLFKVRFVPTYLVVWGYIGAVCILILNYTNIPESIGMLFALPIITNEIYLGVYLIIKNKKVKLIIEE